MVHCFRSIQPTALRQEPIALKRHSSCNFRLIVKNAAILTMVACFSDASHRRLMLQPLHGFSPRMVAAACRCSQSVIPEQVERGTKLTLIEAALRGHDETNALDSFALPWGDRAQLQCYKILCRRAIIGSAVAAAVAVTSRPRPASAFEIFGAFDGQGRTTRAMNVLSQRPGVLDATVYPPSMIGLWQCERAVVAVEGDAAQAQGLWSDLGGCGEFRQPEQFYTRFVPSPAGMILDSGFEIDSRVRGAASVSYDVRAPDTLTYERREGSQTKLTVVERSVEPPTDLGFGFNELVRVESATGGFMGGLKLIKTARVKRRFRRSYGESGDRIIEGLEIMKTYRVLDGVADTERPTSATKSQIKLSRPTVEKLKADGVKPFEQ